MVKLPRNFFVILWGWNEDQLQLHGSYRIMKGASLRRAAEMWTISAYFLKRNGLLRPYKVEQRKGSIITYWKPKEFTESLKAAKYVIIPSTEDFSSPLLEEYFKTFGIPTPKRVKICWYCFHKENKLTLLPAKYSTTYYGKLICKRCLAKEMKEELESLNLTVDETALTYFDKQVERLGSLNSLLDRIDHVDKYNEPFLFDVLPADPPQQLQPLDKLSIDEGLKQSLAAVGITHLLPIQMLAVKAGLLKGKDLVIVAGTSAGKTLVAELSGVSAALSKRKFIFIVPLVSLANQKYHEFKKRYEPLGLRVALRVGLSRLGRVKGTKINTNYAKADIIVATYEAFDFILRSGKLGRLGKIGVLAIDEFQLLADEERGPILDGIIARMRAAQAQAQKLYLSATVGNVERVAKDLGAAVVYYQPRPIPIERYLLILNERANKEAILAEVIRAEREVISKAGYKGQTIVFTNSRRRARELAHELVGHRIRASYYHGGLSYHERRRVEEAFEKGKLECVVTTAALGAGVDFPASQVIFETLAMGSKWISVAEFHQMLGRAGRYGYHDRGRVVLVVEPGKTIGRSIDGKEYTEDQIAFKLLTGTPEPIEPSMEPEQEIEQVLASVAMYRKATVLQLEKTHAHLIGAHFPVKKGLRILEREYMIKYDRDHQMATITKLGRATTVSFLNPLEVATLRKRMKKEKIIEIAFDLTPLENVYILERVQADLERALRSRLSSRLFSGGVLDALNENRHLTKLTVLVEKALSAWGRYLLTCSHEESPFCGCPERNLKRIILSRRLEGKTVKEISNWLKRELYLVIYSGDLLDWLERLIHSLEGLWRIAAVLRWNTIQSEAKQLWRLIEDPTKEQKSKNKKGEKEKKRAKRVDKTKQRGKDSENL